MKALITVLSLIALGFIGWQLWFALSIGVKEPKYTVLGKKDGYEIRKYEPYIVAEVDVTGTPETGANKGFKVLADYIFGKNTENVRMSMTSPVLVRNGEAKSRQSISFVMPFKYTLKTLPKPQDKQIKIEEKKGKIFAAYRFTWYPSDERVARKKELFKTMLERDNIKPKSEIILARYNPPFILPFLMRNELLVEVKNPGK